jgi:phosphate transport system permease protein
MKNNPFVLNSENKSHKSLIKRKKAETRFYYYGYLSILTSIAFLAFLLVTIFGNGFSAFEKTQIKVRIDLTPILTEENLEPTLANIEELNFRKIISDSLKISAPENLDRRQVIQLSEMLSRAAFIEARNKVINRFKKDGKLDGIVLWLTASSKIDMVVKGKMDLSVPEYRRKVTDFQVDLVNSLQDKNSIRRVFNLDFLTSGDSREPESAGIYGSLVGSFFSIIVCMLLAIPVGIGSAIYLEEFAPKNKLKIIIEIAINNLAAIPSIVYGLLGLMLYLHVMGLPRSSALVGGLTLALLVLPVIIVSTRNAIGSVPPSIKDAATALGASKMQVVFHHLLPLSMPGIMTGAILSMARALGETAPLLLIGMVAFVRDIPEKITDSATALPVQIFLWSDLPEQGFVEKTSAAIIVLLLFLILANGLAVYLRKKFEYKW